MDPFLDGLTSDLEFWKRNDYHLHARHVHHAAMNWKLLTDTFLEDYHFGFLHGESLRGMLKPNICDFRAFVGPTPGSSTPGPGSTGCARSRKANRT
jgi:hypothetical protein